jgi:hypothetical protein
MGSWLQFGRGELGWVVGCSLGGESWHGEEEGEIEEERVGKVCIYGFYRWNHQRLRPVGILIGNCDGEWATSLYGDPGLNPLVISSVKSSKKIPRHHTVSSFQNYIYSVGNTVGIQKRSVSIGQKN